MYGSTQPSIHLTAFTSSNVSTLRHQQHPSPAINSPRRQTDGTATVPDNQAYPCITSPSIKPPGQRERKFLTQEWPASWEFPDVLALSAGPGENCLQPVRETTTTTTTIIIITACRSALLTTTLQPHSRLNSCCG